MFDWLARWATLAPERVAIEETASGRELTYAQLDERAARLATVLAARGVVAGDRIAILCGTRVAVFEALFACIKLSATLVPLSWRAALPELRGIVADCEPATLLYDAAHAETAVALLEGVREQHAIAIEEPVAAAHGRYEDLLAAARPVAPSPVALETTTTILYTSGTTGRPKGVQISNRQVLFNALNTSLACDLTSADSCLAFLPLFHTGGLHCLATPVLYRGGRVVLLPQFDAEAVASHLGSGRISTAIGVPTMYQMLHAAGLLRQPLVGVRALMCGGAPLPIPLLEEYHDANAPLRQGYGLTEVGPNCFSLAPLTGPHRLGTVGQPAFHSEARLIDEAGDAVGADTPGELCLRGPHVTTGYWHNPEATRQVLGNDGWFHTGDVLSRNDEGYYRVAGRKKEMFISGGENVYPVEVENLLVGHPWISQAAVKGIDHERWGQVGLAVVVLANDAPRPLDIDALRTWARGRLAGYKIPKQWRVVEELPLNASGKVNKSAL